MSVTPITQMIFFNQGIIIIIIIIIITSVPEEQALRYQALFHYLNHKDIFTISHFQRTR